MMTQIALIQMEVVAGEKERNVIHAFDMLEEAAVNADILVLPEMWTTGYRLQNLNEQACRPGDELLRGLAQFSHETGKWLVAGSVPTLDAGKMYNRSYCFGPQGETASYDKVHLFSLLAEPTHFAAGTRRMTTQMNGVTVGLSICYDLRFPELYRSMTLDGATLMMVPAEWPTSRALPWHYLNVVRAIENQVYVCAVNAVGTYKENIFGGNSALIGPDGVDIVRAGKEETILYGTYDEAVLEKVRSQMSVWKDYRDDVY